MGKCIKKNYTYGHYQYGGHHTRNSLSYSMPWDYKNIYFNVC